ncbi:unnamed protein product, partial [Heterosigma akashiwo]
RHKARLVVKGFTQRYGVDYFETYAGVVRFDTIRACMANAAIEGWQFIIFDVMNAYLTAPIEEEVYIKPPEGVSIPGITAMQVLRLLRALYGTKQAARAFAILLAKVLRELGFLPTRSDPCLYYRPAKDKRGPALVHSHVDDGVIYGSGESCILELLEALHKRLPLKYGHDDLLGCVVQRRSKHEIFTHQRPMLEDIVRTCDAQHLNPVAVPMAHDAAAKDLRKLEPGEATTDASIYRTVVGKLLYPANLTRPDLSPAVGRLARYMDNPGARHMAMVKRTLRYLKGTSDQGLLYRQGDVTDMSRALFAFSDSDWASDLDDRKSTTGHCIFIGLCLVAWKALKQDLAALSTPHAEYVALVFTCQVILFFRDMLKEIGFEQSGPTTIFVDSLSAKYTAEGVTKKSKFIDIKFHFIRDCVAKGLVKVIHIPSEENLADLFTKPL